MMLALYIFLCALWAVAFGVILCFLVGGLLWWWLERQYDREALARYKSDRRVTRPHLPLLEDPYVYRKPPPPPHRASPSTERVP